MTSRTEATVRNELGREYACIENIDEQVGLVLEKLRKNGRTGKHHAFYTADHGIAVGRHGLMGKQNLYEHSCGFPLLSAGPGSSRAPGQAEIITCSMYFPQFVILAESLFPKPHREKLEAGTDGES